MRSLLITPLFLVIFVINPAFMGGCGEVNDEFTYGEAEMLALVTTVTADTWSHASGDDEWQIELELQQGDEVEITRARRSLLSAAWACENRSFVRDAAACIDVSNLFLAGTVSIRDADGALVVDAAPVTGYLTVASLHLDSATLFLQHDGGEFTFRSNDGQTFSLNEASW